MDVKELRCHNIVGLKDRTDFYAQVIAINTAGGVEIDRYFTDDDMDTQLETLNDLTPIKISPEWLVKLGFQSAFGSNINGLWKYYFKVNNSGYTIRLMPKDEIGLFKNDNPLRFLKYVHQLQNIIYDLEGFELFKN